MKNDFDLKMSNTSTAIVHTNRSMKKSTKMSKTPKFQAHKNEWIYMKEN